MSCYLFLRKYFGLHDIDYSVFNLLLGVKLLDFKLDSKENYNLEIRIVKQKLWYGGHPPKRYLIANIVVKTNYNFKIHLSRQCP